jgi:hypothetical protein
MFDNIIDICMYMLEVLIERRFKFCPKFKSRGEVSRLEPAPKYNFLFSYTLFYKFYIYIFISFT